MPAFVLAAPVLSPSALASMGTMATAFTTAANRFGPSAMSIINRSTQSLSNSVQTTFNIASRLIDGTTRALVEYGKGVLRDPASIASYGFGRTSVKLRDNLLEATKTERDSFKNSLDSFTEIVTTEAVELKDTAINGLAELKQRALQNFRF